MEDYFAKVDRFVFKKDQENDMLVGPAGRHYDTVQEAMYYDQLGFCGCGQPEEIHKFVCECLESFDRDGYRKLHGKDAWIDAMSHLKSKVESNPEAAAYFIAYAFDKADLTEHGGSVGGSWLTGRGQQFLELGPMRENEE